MRQLWMIFAQAVTVSLAVLFVVAYLVDLRARYRRRAAHARAGAGMTGMAYARSSRR